MSFPATHNSLSAIPLGSLRAVVLDTETTGLDTASDRIIEIGAVRLAGGHIEPGSSFATLVNPARPIPAASTRIHTIEDGDVADAPGFAVAMTDFINWAGPTVVIGFSIGFDLAILKAEHGRNGLKWHMPHSLDVRHLVELVAPNLPDQSLETAASWLDITVTGRHRALDDAQTAAAIFLGVVPLLRQRGIKTVAQAERASRSLTTRIDEETRAGWHQVGRPGNRDRQNIAEYARVDSFPYRHRVADLMSVPPLIVANDTPLTQALALMVEKNVSSVFLEPDERAQMGIVTERDVMRAINKNGAAAFDLAVGRFGQRPLVTIATDEFVYRALASMAAGGFRHLGVVGPDGKLAGALSARDLLQQRAQDAASLGDSIETAATPGELGRVWSELTIVAGALAHEDVEARDIAAIISRELRALTRRACQLAEGELAQAGKGAAPVPYTLLVLGSGGRGESLLAMDQDNAIIFQDGCPPDAVGWFETLGKRIADILDQAGVAYCDGGVMASNPAWRMDVAGWRSTLKKWIGASRVEDFLNCDIYFDSVPVHGNPALAATLQNEASGLARESKTFLKFLALGAGDFSPPTGWFGRLKLSNGRIDLKRRGIMPIIFAARFATLKHGGRTRSTPQRLEAVRGLNITSDKTIDNLIEAHRVLLGMILNQQLRDIDQGIGLSNKVAPGELTGFERQQLKWALSQIPLSANLLDTPVVG